MGLLQSPDPAIKLARQYGIRGIFTPEIVPSLQPVVVVDDLSPGISNEPQRIACAFLSVTGVAAETSVMRFEVGPNTICKITRVWTNPEGNTPTEFSFGTTVAAPATLATSFYSDGRLRSDGQTPAGVLGTDTFAVAPTNVCGQLAGNNAQQIVFWQEVDWVIGRTDGSFDFMTFHLSTVDQDWDFGIQWTEYVASEVR